MKKIILLTFVCVTAAFAVKRTNVHQEKMSSLLLDNVEALAADEEGEVSDRVYCEGTGTVDCPVSHRKVRYVFEGYGL